MLESYGGCDADRVAAFETLLGFRLPIDYANFLVKNNGGSVKGCVVRCDSIGDVKLDVLFGLGLANALDLKYWHTEYVDELPPECLLIGSTPGGMFILLGTGKALDGVYIYDHAYDHEVSSDEENTFYLCSSFSELYEKVKKI